MAQERVTDAAGIVDVHNLQFWQVLKGLDVAYREHIS